MPRGDPGTSMQLKSIVRLLTAVIGLCALTAVLSLVFITGHLHRLTAQIDANLQSVRAAGDIELQLFLHARNTNQASLLSAPEAPAIAFEAQAAILRLLETARLYVGSDDEATVLASLERELSVYFDKQAELATSGLPPLERYAEAGVLFDVAYELAEELLAINVAQASAATTQAAHWDRIATVIGSAVAAALLLLTTFLIVGARTMLYKPLLDLGNAIRRYSSRDYGIRVQEHGLAEIRAIARAFNEMAEELQRQRAQQLAFVASVAHDLRNPLAAMKSSVEAINAVGKGKVSGLGRMADLVSRQIDVLVRMISDLLDSARIESGHFALTAADQDLHQLVLDAIDLFRKVAPLHELVSRAQDTQLHVHCDGARMSQVINNLLSNAIKYSPEGGRIEVRTRADASGVTIDVSDQGVGIPAEERAIIFEPFRRGRGHGGTIPGVGIGLSVARKIVEAHGGNIAVRSVVGAGSTFSVWLPMSGHGAPGMNDGGRLINRDGDTGARVARQL